MNVSFCCLAVFYVGFYGVEGVAARLSDESQDVESGCVFWCSCVVVRGGVSSFLSGEHGMIGAR